MYAKCDVGQSVQPTLKQLTLSVISPWNDFECNVTD